MLQFLERFFFTCKLGTSLTLFTVSADNAKAAHCSFYLKEDDKMNAVVFQIKGNKMPQ